MKRAGLDELTRAIDGAASYIEVGDVALQEAVDLVCDYFGVVADADRRIVRKRVARRLRDAETGGRAASR